MTAIEPRPPGAPVKLNPTRAHRYCEAIRLGLPNYQAATAAGLGRRTCEQYLNRGNHAANTINDHLNTLTDQDRTTLDQLDDTTPPDEPTRPDGWHHLSPRDEHLINQLIAPSEQPFLRFLREVERAWATFELLNAGLLQQAAQGYEVTEETKITTTDAQGNTITTTTTTKRYRERDWRAGMAMLERRIPERWSSTRRMEIAGPGGGAIEHEVTAKHDAAATLAALEGDERDSRTAEVLAALAAAGVESIEDAIIIEDDE